MSSAEMALTLFALCNAVRLFAYLPQILVILRDEGGARAVSCASWSLFAVSNASTVAYAVLVLGDPHMAALFAANTACCAAILGLTAWKRARCRAPGGAGAAPAGLEPVAGAA